MQSLNLCALAMLASFLAPAAIASEPTANEIASKVEAVRLEPTSPWNLDYAESRCRLGRIFGSEDAKHVIFFEQGSPSLRFQITFGGPEMRRFNSASRIEVGLIGDKPLIRHERPGRAELGTFGAAMILQHNYLEDALLDAGKPSEERVKMDRAKIDPARAGMVDRVVIKRGKRILSFETGNMEKPFEALNTCTRDLLTIWGLDAAKHDRYTPARWTNQRLIAKRLQGKYPSSALRKGEQGIFRLRVIVEPDGTMSECHLDNATLTKSLESPACKEMRHAKFAPALDAQGQPMRSYYNTTITYVIN